MKRTLFGLLSVCFWTLVAAGQAETIESDHVRVSWLAPQSFGAESETLAVRFQLEPGWHIYWKNPGDSGAAPKFRFDVTGGKVGDVQWPFPHRLPVGTLVNLGYDGEVAFPFVFTPEPSASQVELKVYLEWLVCKEECTPGFGELALRRPRHGGPEVVASTQGDSTGGARAQWAAGDRTALEKQISHVPQSSEKARWMSGAISLEPEVLQIEWLTDNPTATAPEIFPTDGEFLKAASPTAEKIPDGYRLRFSRIQGLTTTPQSTGFVLVDGEQAWEFPQISLVATEQPFTWSTFFILLVSAFAGGLLLNFMPCVLPILSIKILSLAQNKTERMKEGWLYTAGVLTTFTALGGLLAILKAGGAALGWGFQLQSPLIVLSLMVLFWFMALNFFGFFEFGTAVMNQAGRWRGGAFGTGILSVFVAAPCTGPFMGTALGAAAVMPVIPSLAIFFFLGAGLAAPFLLLAANPAWRRWLPKPGAWMETLKQFFAFPLLATVLWLGWVLGLQTGVDGAVLSGLLLLILTFAIWWSQQRLRTAWRILPWILALAATLMLAQKIRQLETMSTAQATHDEVWTPYNPQLIEKAREEKRAVFVDFTAAWCITCQVNKQAVLNTDAIQKLFHEKNTLLLRADWTQQNPVITQALAQFGRNSVPLYVFYPANGSAPQVLPQLLSASLIEDLYKETPP